MCVYPSVGQSQYVLYASFVCKLFVRYEKYEQKYNLYQVNMQFWINSVFFSTRKICILQAPFLLKVTQQIIYFKMRNMFWNVCKTKSFYFIFSIEQKFHFKFQSFNNFFQILWWNKIESDTTTQLIRKILRENILSNIFYRKILQVIETLDQHFVKQI